MRSPGIWFSPLLKGHGKLERERERERFSLLSKE
jgi:hypothetical protein